MISALVGLTASIIGATLWQARRRERQAEAAFPPEGEFVDIDGLRAHVVIMGQGPDLVMIHGASGNARDFTMSLAPELANEYRVFVVDRPGLGYSDALPSQGGSIQQQADILRRATAKLGAVRPIVLGQSYGGAVALAWAVSQPDSLAALITLSGASHDWDTPLSRYYKVTSHPILGPLAIPAIAAWVPDSVVDKAVQDVFLPQTPPEGYAADFGSGLTLRRASIRNNALQRAALLEQIKAQSLQYTRITVPVEILHGTADDTVDIGLHAERLAQTLPDAVLTRLDGIGHMPHHVAQSAVIDAVHRAATRAGLR